MDSIKISLNDVRYHVEISAQGRPPLLLLHGFTGSGASWHHVAERLAQTFTVIRIDLLGHGQTIAPDDAARFEMQYAAHDVIHVMRELGFNHFGLHGYSMGGRLALYTALYHPENIAALSLESASPGLVTDSERAARKNSDDALAQRILMDGVPAFVEYWENIPLFASHAQRLDETVNRYQRDIRMANRADGIANSLKGMGTGVQPSQWEMLPQLHRPVLLITGEEDAKFTSINAQMVSQLPNAIHLSIHKAGHTVHLEQHEAWLSAVTVFHRFASKMA